MTFLEAVVGDAGAKVVDMVVSDVSRKPLEDFREFVK